LLGRCKLPIYEYFCESCSLGFEVRKAFGENSGARCPKCGGDGRRVFSPVPIIFKGPGFYVTDSRAKNSAAGSAPGREGGEEKMEANAASDKEKGNGSE